jgi:hypothetical protein
VSSLDPPPPPLPPLTLSSRIWLWHQPCSRKKIKLRKL